MYIQIVLQAMIFFFHAKSSPTLAIDTVPSTINLKSYTFTGTFTQEQGVTWKWFQWTIYDANSVPIDITNQINSGAIEYLYDGFFE